MAETVLQMQKELSDLEAELATKRTEFKLELRKAYPDLPYNAGRGGRGYGKRGGGRGGYGGGPCWR